MIDIDNDSAFEAPVKRCGSKNLLKCVLDMKKGMRKNTKDAHEDVSSTNILEWLLFRSPM